MKITFGSNLFWQLSFFLQAGVALATISVDTNVTSLWILWIGVVLIWLGIALAGPLIRSRSGTLKQVNSSGFRFTSRVMRYIIGLTVIEALSIVTSRLLFRPLLNIGETIYMLTFAISLLAFIFDWQLRSMSRRIESIAARLRANSTRH